MSQAQGDGGALAELLKRDEATGAHMRADLEIPLALGRQVPAGKVPRWRQARKILGIDQEEGAEAKKKRAKNKGNSHAIAQCVPMQKLELAEHVGSFVTAHTQWSYSRPFPASAPSVSTCRHGIKCLWNFEHDVDRFWFAFSW